MKVDEIKVVAASHGLDTKKLRSKKDLVQAIQGAEGNDCCFATGLVDSCGQHSCCWREDCC